MKRCFLIGHRDAPESIYPELCEAVERHIVAYGVQEFLVGSRGAFDRLALRAVAQVKKRHPSVKLTLLLAYLPAKGRMETPVGVDEMVFPDGLENVPYRYAIVRANRWAVEHCEYLIAYVWQASGNARKVLEEAQGKKQITRIGETRRTFQQPVD